MAKGITKSPSLAQTKVSVVLLIIGKLAQTKVVERC